MSWCARARPGAPSTASCTWTERAPQALLSLLVENGAPLRMYE
jgi:hypothetical protein